MGGEGVGRGEGGGLREEVREGDVSEWVSEAVRRLGVSDKLLSYLAIRGEMETYRSSRVWLEVGTGWRCSWWETPFSRWLEAPPFVLVRVGLPVWETVSEDWTGVGTQGHAWLTPEGCLGRDLSRPECCPSCLSDESAVWKTG